MVNPGRNLLVVAVLSETRVIISQSWPVCELKAISAGHGLCDEPRANINQSWPVCEPKDIISWSGLCVKNPRPLSACLGLCVVNPGPLSASHGLYDEPRAIISLPWSACEPRAITS